MRWLRRRRRRREVLAAWKARNVSADVDAEVSERMAAMQRREAAHQARVFP